MYLIPDERFHTERYNTFRIVICVDYYYYYYYSFMWYSTARSGSPQDAFASTLLGELWGDRERAVGKLVLHQ